MQAITKFGCTRLAARVAELRKSWPIETKWQSRNGKRWAVYSLVPR
ncbi:MAG: helix-turn-helix domain-containing protein [Phycisphaerae bacterium]